MSLASCNMTEFDLYTPVEDWYSNMRYGHNPKGIVIQPEDVGTRWKELFSYPYIEQSNDETYEANPIWLKLKENFISGSEVGAALGVNEWESKEDYIQIKAGRKKKIFNLDAQKAMKHGKIKEDLAGLRYTQEVDDVTFKFGIIPHKDTKWSFLGVSPDLGRFFAERPVEIKSPYKRMICYLQVDDVEYSGQLVGNSKDVRVLIREVMISGNKHKYQSITNLPLSWSKLLDKYVYYYEQCQLQAEVMDIGNVIDFTQFGTCPNRFYMNTDLLTVTEVPRDPMWLALNGDTLRKTWDEVLYYRRKDVIVSDKKRKSCQDNEGNNPIMITKEVEMKKVKMETRALGIDDECPFI